MPDSRVTDREEVVAFSIRLPRPLSDKIRQRAKQNRRSLNQEIIWLLEQALRFLDATEA
jgi:hypothetical protein